MEKLKNIYFSQSCIDTYDTCKLKFKKIYIDNINWSGDNKNFGSKFHLLAQRYYVGIDTNLDKTKEEYVFFENLKKFLRRDKNMYPEYTIRYKRGDLKLLAKIDLLKIEENKITIYDWKTNKSKLDRYQLENSYQTKIYLHNVTENFKVLPKNVTLIYYNPRFNEFLEVYYSDEKHLKYKLELKNKIIEIVNQKVFDEKLGKHCKFCQFNAICNEQWTNIDFLLDY
ncbi:PD-(D/E)XK nuclease family protein [Tepidibacter thalassicus]|uniref:PD-(D/E)XK nuclease superfamily protein n=1 Tax=Tepidibacter thalassicus DSM 15285 TaxID=1123350 RepID=A0A1M5QFU0_9FIRM|nr:PD-(D/E)XK nuclease family protein [Tepidibacter thalassicus]SHH12932.1 PD-(D/E)XK nuclease superfamily protein [Tepidibacter thalassicus DSM 15285]